MKIGIITFWESNDNYGQVLQAYALQKVLRRLGHEPFQIKYSLSASVDQNKYSLTKRIAKVILIPSFIKEIKKKRRIKAEKILRITIDKNNNKRDFSKFRNKYIASNEITYYSITEIQNNPPQADCYITGSDQVWSMLLDNDNNKAYFLDFGSKNIKRLSYASSFGRDVYPKELMEKLRLQLKKFDAISVREDSGIAICKCAGRHDAVRVLDPTLLLSKNSYLDIASEEHINRKYIFTYSINIRSKDDIHWDNIEKYANNRGLSLITVTSSGNIPGREILPNCKYIYASIQQWLALIRDSEFVVTTSFHGVVFSIILNKPFVYFGLTGKDSQSNGRALTLLRLLKLENRTYKYDEGNIENIINRKIDWNEVNSILSEEANKSIGFLKSNLVAQSLQI